MKAHKGGYVNKTNEKPVLRVEGEKEGDPQGFIVCEKLLHLLSPLEKSEWCHHGSITEHLLMAEHSTEHQSHSSMNQKR